jgi:hypothetical protein
VVAQFSVHALIRLRPLSGGLFGVGCEWPTIRMLARPLNTSAFIGNNPTGRVNSYQRVKISSFELTSLQRKI